MIFNKLFAGALALSCVWIAPVTGVSTASAQSYPTPAIAPSAWQLDFDYQTPKRIVVETPGQSLPKAYWYLAYRVTNNTDREQMFLPVFEMMTNDGNIIRSDQHVAKAVFDAIKRRENNQFLQPFPQIAGQLLIGEDQAKDGVAIWEEPAARMGRFSIFVSGLSGEVAEVKDSSGNVLKDRNGRAVQLRKTLQLNFHVRGDEIRPGEDQVNVNYKQWIMR